jgi:hypothetical protein
MKEVEFEIVDERYIKICGIQYSMVLFNYLGFAPVGAIMEIVERSEDGVVTIRRHHEAEQDAARYRFLRQSETDLDLVRERILADVWNQIMGKGIDKAQMDAIVDEGIRQTGLLAT